MDVDLGDIGSHFSLEGTFVSDGPYGNGHINDTYAVTYRQDSSSRRYILQRINHRVFKDPERLMANIVAVTGHLSRKIREAGGNPQRETLTLIPTVDGSPFLRLDSGDYWRAYVFIEGARTYESVAHLDHVRSAGRAFGTFQRLLSDFPAGGLAETIPDFHHTGKRYAAFQRAVAEDVCGRAAEAQAEIDFVLRRGSLTPRLVDLQADGRLPLRITHNDTKFNNVMIDDRTGEGVCVIDLDTVMPGLSLYDFGDAIRSIANTGAEDEIDLSKVNFSLEVFDAFAQGYLQAAGAWLEPEELALLPFAAELMTLECGMRFLTDFLQGDTYYKVRRPSHNLDRSRTQFRLVEQMEAAAPAMAESVRRWSPP